MKYYDESGTEITNPDLTKGKITEKTRITGTHQELMPGTKGRGEDEKGLFQTIEDTETYGEYHVYTADELAEQKKYEESVEAAKKQQESINSLPDQITQVQTALCDIYEQLLAK